MALKKTKDHWAFLEEIEAPMWVDLTLEEAKFNSQEIDDEWFRTSHLFHQCSARQLKAAFSCSGEGGVDLEFELPGSSSPNLPASVSRSRGKDYRSKKWRGENCDISLNKPHPVKVLSGKSTCNGTREKIKSKSSFIKPKSVRLDSDSCEQKKPKFSFINSKGSTHSKRSLVCERSSTENAKGNSLKPVSGCRSLESCSSSVVDKASESNTLSMVTSESSLQGQQNIIEVSNQAIGHSSGLLSAVRITLRKSCVTRQASRVEPNSNRRQSTMEINNDKRPSMIEINSDRESGDRKSSSSKSSVGSSSVPRFDVESSTFISTRKKEKTPDSRNVVRMTEASRNKVKVSNVAKVSTVQNNKGTHNSRRDDKINITKSTYKETAKLKVQSHIHSTNSSLPLVNKQNSCAAATKAKEKVKASGLTGLVGGGKENALGKMSNNRKCSGRENAAGCVVRSQSRKQQNVSQRGVTRVLLAGQKGKISDRSEGKNSLYVNQRVHLR
ncbi:Cyclic nucleotide-gated channel [Melia azedarach]|uniref:Cyclic nucleotide-gated channel n=1 Tax=Melia azedarach TaxID=155640 RepID=A0ACC1YSN3_MELAZ|nr:Cyclic nucleotide-gated channel [Melia azedarach]